MNISYLFLSPAVTFISFDSGFFVSITLTKSISGTVSKATSHAITHAKDVISF